MALKTKLDKDSTHLQADNLVTNESNSQRFDSTQEHIIRPPIAYEIAASAASHMQRHAKNESCSSTCGDGDHVGEEEEVCRVPRGSKSERAAQMAASTMTAVVAAREREREASSSKGASITTTLLPL